MSCDTKFVFLYISNCERKNYGKSITHAEFQCLIKECSVLILDFYMALDFEKEIKSVIINGVFYDIIDEDRREIETFEDYDEYDETDQTKCLEDCLCKKIDGNYIDYSNLDTLSVLLESMDKLETVYVNPSNMYMQYPGTIETYIPFWSNLDHKLDVYIHNFDNVYIKPLVNGNLNNIDCEQYNNVLKKMLKNQFEKFECFHH